MSARSFKGAKLPDEFSDLSEPEEALIHPAAEDPALRGKPSGALGAQVVAAGREPNEPEEANESKVRFKTRAEIGVGRCT